MFKLVRVRFCRFVSYQVSAEELGTVQVDLGPHHFLPHHIYIYIQRVLKINYAESDGAVARFQVP